MLLLTILWNNSCPVTYSSTMQIFVLLANTCNHDHNNIKSETSIIMQVDTKKLSTYEKHGHWHDILMPVIILKNKQFTQVSMLILNTDIYPDTSNKINIVWYTSGGTNLTWLCTIVSAWRGPSRAIIWMIDYNKVQWKPEFIEIITFVLKHIKI